jgi:hypothetical protein
MIEFHVLSGRRAGTVITLQQPDCLVGRARTADVQLDDPGVWDQHLEIQTHPAGGIFAHVLPPALAALNSQPFSQARLRNGDVLSLGEANLRFWIRRPQQRSLLWREIVTWAVLGLLSLVPAGLFLWFN